MLQTSKAVLESEPEPLLVVATEAMSPKFDSSFQNQDIEAPLDASGVRSEDTLSSSSGPHSSSDLELNQRMKLKAEFSIAYQESLEIGVKEALCRDN
jgi:hypothetical protein